MRPIDERRINASLMLDRELSNDDRWYIHSVLAQCFLPYRDPKSDEWTRENGSYGIVIQSGLVPKPGGGTEKAGIPYGAKPRLINSYIQTYAIKYQTPIVPIEHSMSSFMRALGFQVTGGKRGTIHSFQKHSTSLAASRWILWGLTTKGSMQVIKTDPYKRMELWFPSSPEQEMLWPSEVELTEDFYYHLREHAIPYDFRALSLLRENARAQDVYLWLVQRLPRISKNKPLNLAPEHLYAMFGGGQKQQKVFMQQFRETLKLACLAYPEAKVEELKGGWYQFKASQSAVAKVLKIGSPRRG